jgi:molybdopterin molybdotransferase
MQTVHEILGIIGQKATPLPAQRVPLGTSMGCKLARSVTMDIDSPPFDRALLDGYAVRAVDALANAQLKIVGRHDAGGDAHCQVAQGQCVAINTGAPIPAGADAVAMVEITRPAAGFAAFIQLSKAVAAGTGIQHRASDARAGQVVLNEGTVLTPAALAVAAAAGADHLWVYPPPRVAILATGDELVPITARPGPSQIRNTNSTLMRSLLAGAGIESLFDLDVAPDNPATIKAVLVRGLANADVLIVTGGMSMGTRDLVPHLLLELGVEIHVQKARMKPGKPFLFATFTDEPKSTALHGDAPPTGIAASPTTPASETMPSKYIIGLPGNPVSALVCFKRFVEPLLLMLRNLPANASLRKAACATALPPNGDREFYQPCNFTAGDPVPTVTPLEWHGSADIYTLAKADALIVHPASAPARDAHTVVDFLML